MDVGFNPAKNGNILGILPCLQEVCHFMREKFLKGRWKDLTELMMTRTKVIGNVTSKRPTVYVFPAGQGNAALMRVQGFNILVDGGHGKRAAYWDFVRHLER